MGETKFTVVHDPNLSCHFLVFHSSGFTFPTLTKNEKGKHGTSNPYHIHIGKNIPKYTMKIKVL